MIYPSWKCDVGVFLFFKKHIFKVVHPKVIQGGSLNTLIPNNLFDILCLKNLKIVSGELHMCAFKHNFKLTFVKCSQDITNIYWANRPSQDATSSWSVRISLMRINSFRPFLEQFGHNIPTEYSIRPAQRFLRSSSVSCRSSKLLINGRKCIY